MCQTVVLIFTIHSFPLVFFPMSRIQTNKQVSFFQKRKNAYWLVNNCHKTQETSEQQLKKNAHFQQRHTNTRKAASPHTTPHQRRPAHQSFTRTARIIAVCRICHLNSLPFATPNRTPTCTRNPNPNTNQRRRYHTSQNESVPTSKSQPLPNLGLSFITA